MWLNPLRLGCVNNGMFTGQFFAGIDQALLRCLAAPKPRRPSPRSERVQGSGTEAL